MQQRRSSCPKCRGQLYLERDANSRFRLPVEWCCFQCGWRQTYTPAELERTFAVTVLDEDVRADGPAVA